MDRFIDPKDPRYSERARRLVQIGRQAIAKADDKALDAYFSEDYVLHGPSGDIELPGLKAFFENMRAAFSDFACERLEVVEQGDFIASRTVMTGTFDSALSDTAVGTIEPNHRPMRRELMNIFRFDANGKLAEEWVQYDDLSFLKQLSADIRQDDRR